MKKNFVVMLMMPLLAFLLFACGGNKADVKMLEGKWNIVEANGQKIEKEGFPNLEFNLKDKKVHGNTGCNIFNASLVLDEANVSSIKFDQAMSTMMACPNMDIETVVLKAINEVRAVKAGKSDKQLNLVDSNDKVVLVLSKE